MKKRAYAVTETAASLISDEIEAKSVFHSSGIIGIEYNHTINGSVIKFYNTIVFQTRLASWVDRVEEVEKLYGVIPSEIRTKGEVTYFMYKILGQWLLKQSAIKVAMWLSSILDMEYQWGIIPEFQADSCESKHGVIKPVVIKHIIDTTLINIADSVSETQAERCNDINIGEVVEAMWTGDLYDLVLNIVPEIGKPYNYAVAKMGIDNAHKFFNEKFNAEFELDDKAAARFLEEGEPINTPAFSLIGGWYSAEKQSGWEMRVTDFTIYVHYRLVKHQEITYFVSFRKANGKRSRQIEWTNTVSEAKLAEILLKLWPYHFTGTKGHIQLIHQYITATNVPNITSIPKYGNVEMLWWRYFVLYDGVCDLENRTFYPKNENEKYYFVNSTDGFIVEGNSGNQSAAKFIIPSFGNFWTNSFDEFMEITKSIYGDYSAEMILVFACWILGYSLYQPNYKSPISFITWPTGTGKTTFAQIISVMFNQQTPLSAPDTTPFALKTTLTASEWLPVFLSEFRSDGKYTDQQEKIFRTAFDKSLYMSGRADKTVDTDFFTAQIFIEWEDISESGSVRTRSVIWKTKASGRKNCNPLDIINNNKEVLSSFQSSYISSTCKFDYDNELNYARKTFYKKGIENRILDNICVLYAGVMAFAWELHRDRMKEIFDYLLQIQITDFENNWTTSKFIALISRYLDSQYAKAYISKDSRVIISWSDLVHFIEKNRIKTDLALDSYKDNLEWVGFKFWMNEVKYRWEFDQEETKLVKGLSIGIHDCPKEFFVHKNLYKYAKEMNISVI